MNDTQIQVINALQHGKFFEISYGEDEEYYVIGSVPAWMQVIPAVSIDRDNNKIFYVYQLQGFVRGNSNHPAKTDSPNEIIRIMEEYGSMEEWEEKDYAVKYSLAQGNFDN